MDLMTNKKDFTLFLKVPENAQKLNDLVQDVRYALMDYQVYSPKSLVLTIVNICPDFVTTRYLQ